MLHVFSKQVVECLSKLMQALNQCHGAKIPGTYWFVEHSSVDVCSCCVLTRVVLACLQRSADLFKNYMNGNFGAEIVAMYLTKLKCFGELGAPFLARDCFVACLVIMGDVWRRFIFERDRFPYKLFALLEANSLWDFLCQYKRMQQQLASCSTCFDVEFSHAVLSFISASAISDLDSVSDEVWAKVKALREFLQDVSIFAPLSADGVECVHGYYQHKLHRFRGTKVSDPRAQELTLWSTVTTAWGKFWDQVWAECGDEKMRHRLPRFGRTGTNQYTPSDKRCGLAPSKERAIWNLATLDQTCDQPLFAQPPRRLTGDFVLTLF